MTSWLYIGRLDAHAWIHDVELFPLHGWQDKIEITPESYYLECYLLTVRKRDPKSKLMFCCPFKWFLEPYNYNTFSGTYSAIRIHVSQSISNGTIHIQFGRDWYIISKTQIYSFQNKTKDNSICINYNTRFCRLTNKIRVFLLQYSSYSKQFYIQNLFFVLGDIYTCNADIISHIHWKYILISNSVLVLCVFTIILRGK